MNRVAANKHRPPVRPLRRWLAVLAVAVVAASVVLAIAAVFPWGGDPPEVVLAEAEAALRQGNYALAEELALRIEPGEEGWERSRLVAGEAASRAGRVEAAREHYAAISEGSSSAAVMGAFALGELLRGEGHLFEAQQQYSHVLAHQPHDAQTHERMAFLLGVSGQHWESMPHFMFLLRSQNWTLDALALLGDLERPVEQEAYLRHCAKNAPHDVLVRSGLAAYALSQGKVSQAEPILRKVVAERPELLPAQVMLGEILVDGSEHGFLNWHRALPPLADTHPDIWYVRGLWARRSNQLPTAARCFWETLRRIPEHRRATYQLGQVMGSLGMDGAEEVAARATKLFELTQMLDQVLRSRGRDPVAVRRVAELTEETGRYWEAWAWAVTAAQLHPDASWPAATVDRLSRQLHEDLPRTIDSANIALQHSLSNVDVSSDVFASPHDRSTPEHGDLAPGEASIEFVEQTAVGIDFVYNNGADPETRGARMFEQTGGGVGVVDYDGDGWPDLYFTQGGEWKTGSTQPVGSPEARDVLYRNLDGGSFVDIAAEAGLDHLGFGQGVNVGDYNNDGFPDLYVANIGENRLYRNNGDGTFTDATELTGSRRQDWTSSCVIVDLNGDGLPDLFDVNYVTGPDVYEKICGGRGCSPKVFDGTPDQLWMQRENGTFRHAPDVTPANDANGLGVVAAILGEDRLPSLFVSNDQVPNFLLRINASDPSGEVRVDNDALLRGLAYNGDGLALACMGIAADDVDGNGLIDFMVTNFLDEPNTLYLQDTPGLFADATQLAGVKSASYPYVGWGAQFIDADLDGDMDLVIANGHIDDYRDEGGEYHMLPHFFRNTGGGRFVQLSAEQAGEYFGRKYLGRGLARLDWNRDGRMDFVVSNIGTTASLVSNRSTGTGNFLNVRLHGTTSARDAIGSTVEVSTERDSWKRQLVAGDGYMASNERMLQFGLGNATEVAQLSVSWPTGSTATIENLPVGVTVELVEGSPVAILSDGSQRPVSLNP